MILLLNYNISLSFIIKSLLFYHFAALFCFARLRLACKAKCSNLAAKQLYLHHFALL